MVVAQHQYGVILLGFDDIRDAWKASLEIPRSHPGWISEFVSPKAFVKASNPVEEPLTSDCEGQVIVTATFTGSKETFDPGYIELLLQDLARVYGEVMAQQIISKGFPTVRLRVEYFSLAVASRLKVLNDLYVGVRSIRAKLFFR